MRFKLLIITLLFLFYGCDDKKSKDLSQQKEQSAVLEQDYTKPFTLTLQNNQTLSMQTKQNGLSIDNNDKAILFSFFTTWCPPCKAEIPHLNEIQSKFGQNLRIIGVLMENKTDAEISNFIDKNSVNFEIATGEANIYFSKAIGGINGVPYMILYNQNGDYVAKYIGLVPPEMLIMDISKVLM